MVKIYKQPFAHAGLKQVIPDASDPQGFVSNEDGFTSDYELPDTDPNYKPIERAEFNGLMNMVTEAVGELQQFGFAKWQAGTWPQGARVIEGGVVYRALTQTSQKPPHADWVDDMGALNTKADKSVTITAGTGLSGGGDLSANRTLSVNYGTTAGTAAQGNDSRIANSVQTSGNQTVAGTKTFTSFPVTPSTAPTASYQVANKKYVDDMVNGAVVPSSITGSVTLNGTTNNTVALTNIVTTLSLEVGDVIRINTGAYNKLHTVESITNNNSIIVNYEHAGNRGNGSLKLPNFTGQATVTRIAKWFNAPIGLGQDWVNMQGKRANDTTLLNSTNRVISVSAHILQGFAFSVYLFRGGNSSTGQLVSMAGSSFSNSHREAVYGNVVRDDYYAVRLDSGDFNSVAFWELR